MIRQAVFVVLVLSGVGIPKIVPAGAQGAKTISADCGFSFRPHEERQLQRAGWQCDKEDVEVAKKMKKRGFIARQYVDAYILAHDIPRTTPKDVETVAVLELVDVNPRYYFMIDEPKRPSLTTYYNKKLRRRGRILTIVGWTVALAGAGVAAYGIARFKREEFDSQFPAPLGIVLVGAAAFVSGTVVGNMGLYKLRLISDEEILDTGSMQALRKRRTKTHHFAPDDLFDYQMAPPERRFVGSLAPVVGNNMVGLSAQVSF